MEQIIVGVDGSESAARALKWAEREASLRGQEPTAVLAWGFLDQHQAIVGERFDPEYGEEEALVALDGFVTAALGEDVAAGIQRRVISELAAHALVDLSTDAALLVVGARGLGGFRGLLLGSVSEYCLRHSACPVAVIRTESRPPIRGIDRIVVGVDGSDNAERALWWAIDEARLRDAQLDIVHSWHVPYVGGHPFMSVAPLGLDALEQAAESVVETILDREHDRLADLQRPARPLVRCGGATATILDVADGAQLIVVGTRGFGSLRGMIVGSVSHQLAHHAECPVVVVPPEQA